MMIFAVGISSAYRISDQLKLRVGNVRARSHFDLTEKKTGNDRRVPIDADLRALLDDYTQGKPNDEFLFKSREKDKFGDPKPLSRSEVYNILNKAARKVGITERIGCHTMRKTFGYHHYKKYRDVATLMQIYGHARPDITLRYIGITQDMMDKTVLNLRILKGKIPKREKGE
jgi:integrase